MSIAHIVPVRVQWFRTDVLRWRLRFPGVGSTLVVLILFASGCFGAAGPRDDDPALITVEGRVTYYGNAPFEQAALVTDDGNWYVLDLTDEQASGLVTPTRQHVRGRVYLGDWNGRPFAHLTVHYMERVNRSP
jgi:hypothetical protein